MIARQVGAFAVALFVFFAFIAATSRLLRMKELPDYINNVARGIGNLFSGVFAK